MDFSVYWWDAENNQHCELNLTSDFEKVKSALDRLTQGSAAIIGIVRRVIVVDPGDCINFEWRYGEGLVFPTQEQITLRSQEH